MDCSQASISAIKLEPEVKARVKALLEPIQISEMRAAVQEAASTNLAIEEQGQQDARRTLQKRKTQLEERLTTLENVLLDSLIQPARYAVRRDEILAELRGIEQSVARLTVVPRPAYDAFRLPG